jgi:hypothetical protein
MLYDGFLFTTYQPGDELIDISALLAGDSLLANATWVPENDPDDRIPLSVVYPNPSNERFNIRLLGDDWGGGVLEITDLSGRKVDEIPIPSPDQGSSVVVWVPSAETFGIYFYRAHKAGKTTASGKMVFIKDR